MGEKDIFEIDSGANDSTPVDTDSTSVDTDSTSVDTDSILQSIKKNLGLSPERTEFDPDIILHINSCLSKLTQLGIGPKETIEITGDDETWDLIYTDSKYNMLRTYMYLSVRLLFDPPSTTTMYEAFQRKIEELEWRLYILADEENTNDE